MFCSTKRRKSGKSTNLVKKSDFWRESPICWNTPIGSGGIFVRRMGGNFLQSGMQLPIQHWWWTFYVPIYPMRTNYTECLCSALSLHLAVVVAASCKMRPWGCEAPVHKDKMLICLVFQRLFSFSQHVWLLRGWCIWFLFWYKNITYLHVFLLFTACMQMAEMRNGKWTGEEIAYTVTSWRELKTALLTQLETAGLEQLLLIWKVLHIYFLLSLSVCGFTFHSLNGVL